MTRPRARTGNLLTQAVGDEVVLYDTEQDRAHRLNPTAAAVWRWADGTLTVGELAARLARELGAPADEALVWLALDRLRAEGLLVEPAEASPPAPVYSRRQVLERIGAAGAAGALLPVVSTLLAPTAAQAAGSGPPGSDCSEDQQCASGVCDKQNGVCV